jgi:hypothetical protein
MLKVTVCIRKIMLMKDMMLSSSTVTKAVSMTVATKINGPNYPLEDAPHHTDVSGKLIACSVVQYSQLNLLITPFSSKVASSDQTNISENDCLYYTHSKQQLSTC